MNSRIRPENVIKNLEDFLHTDNVKVYRNVQASIVEELDRRTGELKEELQKTQKKSGILFPLVLITMILSATESDRSCSWITWNIVTVQSYANHGDMYGRMPAFIRIYDIRR